MSCTSPAAIQTVPWSSGSSLTLPVDLDGGWSGEVRDLLSGWRLSQGQHWAWTGSRLQEQADQRVSYYYDSNPCGDGNFSAQNTWGRLAAVVSKMGTESPTCVYDD